MSGNYAQTGEGFQPFCDDDTGEFNCVGMWGPYNMEIVDMIKIPDDLPAGDYVLGWRWDCGMYTRCNNRPHCIHA